MAPTPLQQGDPPQIGRYMLTARLGAGGMGVVYLGTREDGQQVAVKVLRPEYADDSEFRARFRREVQAMVRVQNRYTVRVLDAETEAVAPYLVTDFAEGPALDEHVKTHGPLHPEAVVRLASALIEAIAAIHAAGVTHRDLKPSNVLLTDSGPMVIDFGIAQTADSVSITRTGMAVGSPGYMAPEQITGHAGQEADLFTWALIVAFAASGQPPFGTGQPAAILHRIISGSPDISAVPPQLMPLVQAALDREPSRRPRAEDLLRELAPGALGGISPRTVLDPGMTPQTMVDRQGQTSVRGNAFDQGRTRTMASEPGPPPPYYGEPGGYGGPGGYGDRGYGYGEPGPRRRWLGPAAVAAVAVVAIAVIVALMSNGGGNKTPAGTTVTPPGTTAPAAPAQQTAGTVPATTQAPPTTAPATTQAPTTAPATTQAPTTAPPTTQAPTTAPATTAPSTGAAAPTATATAGG